MNSMTLLRSAALTITVATSLAMPATASKGEMSHIDRAVLSVCVEASQDDAYGLVKTLKAYRISKDNAVKKVVCNAQSLMDFARAEQAHRVVKLLTPVENRINGNVTIKDVDAPL